MYLKGKRLVIGITGSIAAYKTASLIRLLIKEGAEVQVVITPSGKEFITPLTLSTLTQKPVVSEFFDKRDGSWNSHVDLGLWADLMLIAPVTASTLAKMAYGIADNMLLTSYLSMKAPVWVAPAMDLDMYRHPATQNNLKILQDRGVKIIDADTGFLASGLEGKGRMAEPEFIRDELIRYFAKSQDNKSILEKKKVLITAGPTYESIDAVRYIGNHSSGKMGYALAEVFRECGALVNLVSGPTAIPIPEGVTLKKVVSANEMLRESQALFPECDIAIFCAAVADYRPENIFDGKIKRETKGDEIFLRLIKNPDIASTLAANKTHQYCVGFALESAYDEDETRAKMQRKNMNMMVLNTFSEEGTGFATDTNKVRIFYADKLEKQEFPLSSKKKIAEGIVNQIIQELEKKCKD